MLTQSELLTSNVPLLCNYIVSLHKKITSLAEKAELTCLCENIYSFYQNFVCGLTTVIYVFQ